MIVGKGDIASVLPHRHDLLFFAAGISDQGIAEHEMDKFNREYELLMQIPTNMHLVYFSTLHIFDSNTPFTSYKKIMEKKVRNTFKTYTIVRIGNITWAENPNDFLFQFRQKIKTDENHIMDGNKYMIGKKEFQHWMNLIPAGQIHEMNITGRLMSHTEIYESVVKNEFCI